MNPVSVRELSAQVQVMEVVAMEGFVLLPDGTFPTYTLSTDRHRDRARPPAAYEAPGRGSGQEHEPGRSENRAEDAHRRYTRCKGCDD